MEHCRARCHGGDGVSCLSMIFVCDPHLPLSEMSLTATWLHPSTLMSTAAVRTVNTLRSGGLRQGRRTPPGTHERFLTQAHIALVAPQSAARDAELRCCLPLAQLLCLCETQVHLTPGCHFQNVFSLAGRPVAGSNFDLV